jgi:hypothetical protein
MQVKDSHFNNKVEYKEICYELKHVKFYYVLKCLEDETLRLESYTLTSLPCTYEYHKLYRIKNIEYRIKLGQTKQKVEIVILL